MRAAPYDLRTLGYAPVEIETAAGKAAYVTVQRDLSTRAQVLRLRIIDACNTLSPGAKDYGRSDAHNPSR